MGTAKILVDAVEAAAMLSTSERRFYDLLRENPGFAAEARVILGRRCVRFKVTAIQRFVDAMPAGQTLPEPQQLKAGKARRAAEWTDPVQVA